MFLGISSTTYNRAGTAEKVTFDGTEYVKLMAYDAKGQLSLAAFDNELMTRYAYDTLTFRLKRVRTERYEYTQTGNTHEYDYLSGNVRQDLVYDYDLVGNILKQTNLAPDSGIDGTLDGADKLVRMFKYDPLYRLLEATGRESSNQSSSYTWNEVNTISVANNALNYRAYTQRYEYDKNGRMLRTKHVANSNNYTRKYNYAAGNNRLDSIDNGQSVPTVLSSFGYDNNGNQTGANTERHYQYDAGDMMRAYYNQTSAGVEPTVYAHYVYSGGARTKKLVRTASNVYESMVYLGPFEYHKKVTASTTEEKNYTKIIGGIEIRTGSFMGDISDTVVYSLGDHLGSVSTRVNSGRTIIDSEEYYPYGDNSMRTTDKKRYRYTGKEKDAESGLYYYGARYYTAWACTFTTVDPAAGATHYQSSYNYADCNPIRFNDPTGMQATEGQGGGSDKKDSGAGGGTGGDGSDIIFEIGEVVVNAGKVVHNVASGSSSIGGLTQISPSTTNAGQNIYIRPNSVGQVNNITYKTKSVIPESSKVPESYYNHDLDVDMSKTPKSVKTLDNTKSRPTTYTSPNGAPRNSVYYWNQLLESHPHLFDDANTKAITKGNSPVVNETWIKYNPQHGAFKGEALIHHHIDRGNVATALPEFIHQKWSKVLHSLQPFIEEIESIEIVESIKQNRSPRLLSTASDATKILFVYAFYKSMERIYNAGGSNEAIAREIFSWSGAFAGGEFGAMAAYSLGPWASFASSLIFSILGAYFGEGLFNTLKQSSTGFGGFGGGSSGGGGAGGSWK